MKWLVIVVVAAAAWIAPAVGATAPSGLHGRVVKACPIGVTCTRPPLQIWLVFARAGRSYRFHSAVNGVYRAVLPPGSYTVRTLPRLGIALPRIHPSVVRVRAGHVDSLDFVISTEQP